MLGHWRCLSPSLTWKQHQYYFTCTLLTHGLATRVRKCLGSVASLSQQSLMGHTLHLNLVYLDACLTMKKGVLLPLTLAESNHWTIFSVKVFITVYLHHYPHSIYYTSTICWYKQVPHSSHFALPTNCLRRSFAWNTLHLPLHQSASWSGFRWWLDSPLSNELF